MKLIGHSGCDVRLIEGHKSFVRKTSKDIDYNKRLIRQCQKQKNYSGFVPKILSEGYDNNLYYFDMEFIRGESVASLLRHCLVTEIENICDLLIDIIKENRATRYIIKSESTINRKIKNTHSIIKEHNDVINEVTGFLMGHDWTEIECSNSHGDLTFENIIYSYDDKKYYLIDFLDLFYDTWIADVSKIFQDLIVGWSFRNEHINENTKIRILLLNKKFVVELSKFLNKKTWTDIYSYLLLDLLRIIPYITEDETYEFVIGSMKSILKYIEKGEIHEYLNNTLCWPINTFSRCQA